jgi:hypothetical protein
VLRPAALALALATFAAANARAHFGPAAVKSVLAMEGGEPTLLRLNEGMAIRRGPAWHYVCPALWGDVEMRDADSAQGGPVLVGADSGVWLFQADGSATVHPDPAAGGGIPLALAASRADVMHLRLEGDVTRLLRVGAQQAEVVWSDLTPWDTMAVGDDFVVVMRMFTGPIEMLRLETDGSELGREMVMGPESSLGAGGRVVGSSLYVTVSRLLPDTSWGMEAGLIENGAWRSLYVGVSFVGPTLGPQGELVVALDGRLSVLEGDAPRPLPLETVVNCVDEFQGFIYACDSVGLREITAQGPGPALFELESVQAPELDLVPADKRELCTQQWEFFQQDLAWVGSTVANRDGGVPDGGVADGGAADGGAPDGSAPAAGGGGAQGGVLPVASGGAPASRDSGGCRLTARAHDGRSSSAALVLVAVLLRRIRSPRNTRRISRIFSRTKAASAPAHESQLARLF